MFYNEDLRQNGFGYGEGIDININNSNTNTNQNVNMNMNENFDGGYDMGMMTGPVMEPGRERVVQRDIVHEVKHVCPINTRIINHHVYRHTYSPMYTCTNEDVVSNVCEKSCGL